MPLKLDDESTVSLMLVGGSVVLFFLLPLPVSSQGCHSKRKDINMMLVYACVYGCVCEYMGKAVHML